MAKIRRVNFYAGPGAGKSTTAPNVFSQLKNKFIHDGINMHVEIVLEYIKNWAYEGRKPASFDQVYIFAQQMHREDILLRSDIDLILTDSPLLLNYSYGEKENRPGYKGLLPVVQEFEAAFPGLHIFIDRGDRPYVAKGRYQNEEQARMMDSYILSQLEKYHPNNHVVVKYNDIDRMMAIIYDSIGIPRAF